MNIKRMIVTAVFLACGMLYTGGTASLQAQSAMTTGIKVHGDWTIEIRNAGGDLVTRRTFSNHLTLGGANRLSSILARKHPPGEWGVRVGDGVGCVGGINFDCLFRESFEGDGKLTLSLSDGKIVLSGASTVTIEGEFTNVQTLMLNYSGEGSSSQITIASLLPTAKVSVGQIIQVKVVISFS